MPLAALLDAPTVRSLAAHLRARTWSNWRYLVCLRHGSAERPPFFCVHGAGGNVLSLRGLAMALPSDLPFYGLQAKGLDGSEPFNSVEEAARTYVEEMRARQPIGPYYLGGGCYGGIVAFEMARLLRAQGERVAALVMIDSSNFAVGSFLPKHQLIRHNLRFYASRAIAHTRKLVSVPAREWGPCAGR